MSEAESGYLLCWKLHEGAKKTIENTQPLKNIVYSLVEPYQNQGYILYMDRFYSTLPIARELLDMGFGCVGAIMRNRLNITDEMKKEIDKLKRHESLFYIYKSSLMLTCWKDSKIVHVISTFGEDLLSTVTRNGKDNEGNYCRKEVDCPEIIKSYINNAKGVDLLDQMIGYYEAKNRSRKWCLRLVLHFLQVAAHNSFLIHRWETGSQINYLEYLKSIVKSLVYEIRLRKYLIFTPGKKKK